MYNMMTAILLILVLLVASAVGTVVLKLFINNYDKLSEEEQKEVCEELRKQLEQGRTNYSIW